MNNLIELVNSSILLNTVRHYLQSNSVTQVELDNALFKACKYGYVFIAQLLLEWGADPHTGGPIFWSSLRGHIQVVQLLLDWGVCPNDYNSNCIIGACEEGRVHVLRLLLDSGGDPQAQTGWALNIAAKYLHWPLVELLLERGAFINERALEDKSDFILESLLKIVLDQGMPEDLYLAEWPDRLKQKYNSQIQKINQKIVD